MFIELKKGNIFTVVWNDFSNLSQAELQALKPEDCLKKVEYMTYKNWNYGLVYDFDNFYSQLNFYDGSLENKSVYIDQNCNIDINELGITKKRKHNLADICIIPKYTKTENKVVILYNEDDDEYIIIDNPAYAISYNALSYIRKLFNLGVGFLDSVISYNLFPNYKLIFKGKVHYIQSKKKLKFFQNAINYHNCVYEDDYRTFIMSTRIQLDDDMFENIVTLFNSSEKENNDLALQLLYTTNPRPYSYRIIKMLFSRYYALDAIPFYHDPKFNEFLSRMNITKRDLKNHYFLIREHIYNITGEKEKRMILDEIVNEYKQATHQSEIRLKSYKFADITIEPTKVIINEKDLSNSRE